MKTFKQPKSIKLDDVLEAKGYDSKYIPIINEFFSRYQYEFGLSDELLEEKINNFLRNVDVIDIKELQNKAGQYSIKEKRIDIAGNILDYWDRDCILSVFFHEFFHACEDSNLSNSKTFHDEKNFGIAINEIITEMKASRLVHDRRKQLIDSKHILKLQGYSKTIFLGSMLQASFGMSEKEFLMAVDSGEEKFLSIISPEDNEWYKHALARVMFNADILHAISYKSAFKMYSQDDKMNMINRIYDIHSECSQIMRSVIIKNRHCSNMAEFTQKMRYSLRKLNENYKHGCSSIDPKHKLTHGKIPTNESNTVVKALILALEIIDKSKDKVSKEEYEQLMEDILEIGWMDGAQKDLEKIYKRCGMSLEQSVDELYELTDDNTIDDKFLEEDYGQEKWDNEAIKKLAIKAVRWHRIQNLKNKLMEKLGISKNTSDIKRIGVTPIIYTLPRRKKEKKESFEEKLSELVEEDKISEQTAEEQHSGEKKKEDKQNIVEI